MLSDTQKEILKKHGVALAIAITRGTSIPKLPSEFHESTESK